MNDVDRKFIIDYAIKRGDILPVDRDRFYLAESMSKENRDMFALGMGYHAAYITNGEVKAGKLGISEYDLKELETVKRIVNEYGLKSELSE
jgi:hypothetical protein